MLMASQTTLLHEHTYTQVFHTAVTLTCTFTDTMPLKIEQNLDRLQQVAIQLENGLTCLFYATVYDGLSVS